MKTEYFSRAAVMLLMMLLTATTAWADKTPGAIGGDPTITMRILTEDGATGTVDVTYVNSSGQTVNATNIASGWEATTTNTGPLTITIKPAAGCEVSAFTRRKNNNTVDMMNSQNTTVNNNGVYTYYSDTFMEGTYTIKFAPKSDYWIVSFDSGIGGSGTMAPQAIPKGGTANLSPCTFTNDFGKFFAGWNTTLDGIHGTSYADGASITPTANITLYAQWRDECTIHFDANGGTGSMNDVLILPNTSTDLTANAFYREGYVFAGWNTKADGSGDSYADGANITPTGSITLYAQWEVGYIVRFNAHGGSGTMADQFFHFDETQNLRANTFTYEEGYVFVGWSTTSYGSGTSYANGASVCNLATTSGAIVRLYAQWKQGYYVHFEANGGSGTMPDQGFAFASGWAVQRFPLTANAFTRDGYAFAGWSTTPDGSVEYADEAVMWEDLTSTAGETVTLYAQWAPAYYVHFDANGGTGTMEDQTMGLNYSAALHACAFTREGYYFTGWNTSAYGNGTRYTNGASVSNLTTTAGTTVTLYAQWQQAVFTMTQDGSVNMPTTGTVTVNIPDGVTSFHVYDDGGPDRAFSLGCNGKMLLTAPEGKWLRVNGSVIALDPNGLSSGWLIVYDGNSTSNQLFKGYLDQQIDIISTGNQMLLHFYNYQQREPDGGIKLTVTVIDPEDFVQTGTNEYTINTAEGWGQFCDALQDNDTWNRFSGKTVKLGKDITVSRMAGSDSHDFCGTFDGQKNTLTFNYGTADSYANDEYAAPFHYVSNVGSVAANFKDLHVAGDIYTSAKYAAGLIAQHWGTVNVENCRVSTVIHSSVAGDGTHGGFEAMNLGVLNITGCVFDGKLLSKNSGDDATKNCGGFVGWHYGGTTNISYSLYAPATLGEGETEVGPGVAGQNPSATFGRNAVNSITNSYYTRTLGTEQGMGYCFDTRPTNIGGTGIYYRVSGITPYTRGIGYDGRYFMTPQAVSLADDAANNVAAINGYFADVTLTGRKLWKDGAWNTLCLPFGVTISGSPLDGAEARSLCTASLAGGTLTLDFSSPVDALVAGTPYIIRWTRAGDYEDNDAHNIVSPTFSAVTIDATDRPFNSTDGKVTFRGTYQPIEWTATNTSILFLGAENTLYYPQPSGGKNPSINACRAYFELSDGTQQARQFVLNFGEGDGSAGVSPATVADGDVRAPGWYTLDGRKLGGKPSAKGMYINSGRKVVIK